MARHLQNAHFANPIQDNAKRPSRRPSRKEPHRVQSFMVNEAILVRCPDPLCPLARWLQWQGCNHRLMLDAGCTCYVRQTRDLAAWDLVWFPSQLHLPAALWTLGGLMSSSDENFKDAGCPPSQRAKRPHLLIVVAKTITKPTAHGPTC